MRRISRLFSLLLVLALADQAAAWVKDFQPFPDGEATVIVDRFCRSQFCGYPSQREWQRIIRSVMAEWNNTGAAFVFREGTANRTGDPCRQPDTVTVILADPDQLCRGDGPLRYGARTEFQSFGGRTSWQARVYINAGSESAQDPASLRRLLLHEFGHVVGLGHPDDAGQRVAAVMNSVIHYNQLQPDDIAGIQALYPTQQPGTRPPSGTAFQWRDEAPLLSSTCPYIWRAQRRVPGSPQRGAAVTAPWSRQPTIVGRYSGSGPATVLTGVAGADGTDGNGVEYIFLCTEHPTIPRGQQPDNNWGFDTPSHSATGDGGMEGHLENPGPESFQSGIGIISGWVCEADEVEIVINGQAQPVAYGTPRGDTQKVCGDTDNGFGLLFNWNNLGDGTHTAVAFADGQEFARATFTVTTLGTEFLRGAAGGWMLDDFPNPGQSVEIQWSESLQNFVITGTGDTPDHGQSEEPEPCRSPIAGACGEDG